MNFFSQIFQKICIKIKIWSYLSHGLLHQYIQKMNGSYYKFGAWLKRFIYAICVGWLPYHQLYRYHCLSPFTYVFHTSFKIKPQFTYANVCLHSFTYVSDAHAQQLRMITFELIYKCAVFKAVLIVPIATDLWFNCLFIKWK